MASIEDKAQSALEWAKGWPHLDGYLKLNAIITDDNDATLDTTQTDSVIKKFIDGTAERVFTFQLRIIAAWSDGYDSTNVEAMKLASNWKDWVNSQYQVGNVPDFGEDAKITGIESPKNSPALNAVYKNDNLAEYLISAEIFYIE